MGREVWEGHNEEGHPKGPNAQTPKRPTPQGGQDNKPSGCSGCARCGAACQRCVGGAQPSVRHTAANPSQTSGTVASQHPRNTPTHAWTARWAAVTPAAAVTGCVAASAAVGTASGAPSVCNGQWTDGTDDSAAERGTQTCLRAFHRLTPF